MLDSKESLKRGEKGGTDGSGVRGGVHAERTAPAGAEELLAIWERLDGAARADLLAVARGLAAPKLKAGDAETR